MCGFVFSTFDSDLLTYYLFRKWFASPHLSTELEEIIPSALLFWGTENVTQWERACLQGKGPGLTGRITRMHTHRDREVSSCVVGAMAPVG